MILLGLFYINNLSFNYVSNLDLIEQRKAMKNIISQQHQQKRKDEGKFI